MHNRREWAQPMANSANVHSGHGGIFLSGTFEGSRPYKLYIPRGYSNGTPVPLLVALHGCTQDPDNFAAGTRFNMLADTYNFLVLYPQQARKNHITRCWTWYERGSQELG